MKTLAWTHKTFFVSQRPAFILSENQIQIPKRTNDHKAFPIFQHGAKQPQYSQHFRPDPKASNCQKIINIIITTLS